MQQKSGRWIAGSTADPNYLLEGPNGVGGRPIVPHKRELETRGQSCWQQTPCAHESVDMSLWQDKTVGDKGITNVVIENPQESLSTIPPILIVLSLVQIRWASRVGLVFRYFFLGSTDLKFHEASGAERSCAPPCHQGINPRQTYASVLVLWS